MGKKVRREVTVETHEFFVVRGHAPSAVSLCAVCGADARPVAPDVAAALFGVSPRVIYRWIEAGTIHYTESHEGCLLVCPGSLPVSKAFHDVTKEGERS